MSDPVSGRGDPPRLLRNPGLDREKRYGERERRALRPEGGRRARTAMRTWPGYGPTPLRALSGLAADLGVGAVLYKDESDRFGLGSFKALGGAWAVREVLRRREEPAAEVTVACATAGNHGRSVAWGAERFGCRCVVYLPEGASEHRERDIAGHGARVVRPGLDYDAAVRRVRRDAEAEGWTVVADTAGRGETRIPREVTEGYTLLVAEALSQADARPTHVFVQAGVGGLAAAVTAHLWTELGADRPTVVVVEAAGAEALLESARTGRRETLEGPFDTAMRCLACGEPSTLAWRVLGPGADFFLAVADGDVEDAVRRLAAGGGADPEIVAGPSGAAGTAALLAAARDAAAREELGLGGDSRVLVIGTEGAAAARDGGGGGGRDRRSR